MTLVIGLPRQVAVQRYRRADVDLVLQGRSIEQIQQGSASPRPGRAAAD
jgi:hypothetical protein